MHIIIYHEVTVSHEHSGSFGGRRKEGSVNIVELIPTGRAKAISREALRRAYGGSDREMRYAIETARKHHVIVNLSDGKGYFIPDRNDKEDVRLTVIYVAQEESRKKSLEQSLSAAYDFLAKAVSHEA